MTADLRGLDCPRCGAPVPFHAPTCGYCGERLIWPGMIELARGDLIEAFDPAHEKSRWTQPEVAVAGGRLRVTLENGMLWGMLGPSVCDASIAVSGRCLDARGGLGVIARRVVSGKFGSHYVAYVEPGRRTVQLARSNDTDIYVTDPIGAREVVAAVAPVDTINRVELRCADAVLQVRVNDLPVITVVDARYGYGRFGWCVHAPPKGEGGTVVELDRVELAHVA